MPVPHQSAPAASGVPAAEPVSLSDAGMAGRLPAEPTPAFLYCVFPNDEGNWRVGVDTAGNPVWLPNLTKVELRAGTNHVRTPGENDDPSVAWKGTLQNIRDRGGVPLTNVAEYLMRTPCRGPLSKTLGYVHHDRFETPRIPSSRQSRVTKYRQDRPGRDAWLLGLIEQGVIPAPTADLVDRNVATITARVARRLEARDIPTPPSDPDGIPDLNDIETAKISANIQAAAEDAREAVAARNPADAPAKKRRAKKPSKAAPVAPPEPETSDLDVTEEPDG